jgi:error-prone DNA polymerase
MSKTSAIEHRFEFVSDFEFRASDFKPTPVNDLLAAIPPEDPGVYDMIQQADTIGVFQIESRAQMSMLPRLKPECFYDLVIEVAIVRPGPIQGDMVHPYLRRRRKEEPVEFPDDRVRAVLEKTMGVPIFQEQAMRLAVVAAGFTPGEADQLRRAMGAWRKRGTLDVFRRKLISGMTANGYSGEFAERVFKQIRGFGEYGFPESHAASFALLVYVSAWLKRYHPAAFTAALINSQPMGFYAPAQLVADARKHGVTVLPVDVNASEWDCTLEGEGRGERGEQNQQERATQKPGFLKKPGFSQGTTAPALRLGLRLVHGFSESDARRIVEVRAAGAYASYDDFARRTGFSNAVLTRLARADAFRSLEIDRRAALWRSLSSREPAPLFDAANEGAPERAVTLPEMPPVEQVAADYRALGLSLKAHPMKFVRDKLDQRRVASSADLERLPGGRILKVAGLVLLRQRPSTAKGITFVTLEDETGQANLIVRQEIWERYRRAARTATALLATGQLQKEGRVIHILVRRLDDLSEWLAGVPGRSRDFR